MGQAQAAMVLISILIGTVIAGVGSVWLAAALSFGALARYTQHMLSLAAGALLATAFVHLLPEAFESGIPAQSLFLTILGGLIFFFLLDKAELWHHGHEHDPGLPTLDQARAMLLGVFLAPATKLVRTLAEPPALVARVLAARGKAEEVA